MSRTLVLGAHVIDGLRTAGDLLDHLEALSREQRRKMIDRARAELGLPSTEDVDANQPTIHIGTSGLRDFPVLERELPLHLRGIGLGE